MITIREMGLEEAMKIQEIDRSEIIESIYRCVNGVLEQITKGHECSNWDDAQLAQLLARFKHEVSHGGFAVGAFDYERLVGFGVLGHQLRGKNQDQLQIDLLYVSRDYRRQGIGKRITDALSKEAKNRGAMYLYISSTETQSAVRFYQSIGGELAEVVDSELFALEPEDIHMLKKL